MQSNTGTNATMDRTTSGSPVDNQTYDLLQTLTSKLEAIEAYGKYMQDADGDIRQLFEEFRSQDQESVQRIVQMLPQRLNQR